ncbi:hypothetical protein niasHT_019257 [Heterodera trifolii]|uniref:DNA helicase Pif1-like 2B domain-containing protein n=1 Tax=Heterodera trifolii TaxID=157864 RepID=A0ABD2L0M2_9BILA
MGHKGGQKPEEKQVNMECYAESQISNGNTQKKGDEIRKKFVYFEAQDTGKAMVVVARVWAGHIGGKALFEEAAIRGEQSATDGAARRGEVDCENLCRMTPHGVPEHRLRIKVGAIIMIITNISIADGLCNGTRVQILPGPKGKLSKYII